MSNSFSQVFNEINFCTRATKKNDDIINQLDLSTSDLMKRNKSFSKEVDMFEKVAGIEYCVSASTQIDAKKKLSLNKNFPRVNILVREIFNFIFFNV